VIAWWWVVPAFVAGLAVGVVGGIAYVAVRMTEAFR